MNLHPPRWLLILCLLISIAALLFLATDKPPPMHMYVCHQGGDADAESTESRKRVRDERPHLASPRLAAPWQDLEEQIITAYCWVHYPGLTASGKYGVPWPGTEKELPTCAVHPYHPQIKIGDVIEIHGWGTFLVNDHLAKKAIADLDIYFELPDEAIKFGRQKLKVRKLNLLR